MTMGDEGLFSSMALPVVLNPIFDTLLQRSPTEAQTLRAAFDKAESQNPGFAYFFINGVLEKARVGDRIDMPEILLRLEGSGEQEDVRLLRPEPVFVALNEQSNALKRILGRIPDEIGDRKKFLETIKDIAGAIKMLLDAVNDVFTHVHSQEGRSTLEQRKREFVKYSKRFSTTLKEFFKDNRQSEVYVSANHLIHQTNLIMKSVAKAL